MSQFFSVSEFAVSTRISRITVFRYIKNNEIPHVRIGRRILIEFNKPPAMPCHA